MAKIGRGGIDEHAAVSARTVDSTELYRRIIDLTDLIPWLADQEGTVVSTGDRWIDWTGAGVSEALGDGWKRFVHPDDLDRTAAAWATAIRSGQRYDVEWRIRVRDGSYRWCHARGAKRADPSGGPLVWYGILEDVHDRRLAADSFRRAEAELARVSRLSAMGAMATAIAHDLNQPLTAIVHYVRGSRRLLDQVQGTGKADLSVALEDADKSAVRASDIVRRVQEFVTRGTIEARREDLAALVEEACRLAVLDLSEHGIACRVEFDTHCSVLADRLQIQQVLVNLIRNAIQAMEGCPRRELVIRTSAAKRGFCQVAVSDTGRGVALDVEHRLFDPMFTTRREGIGIGLPISRKIVETHGGTIWHEPGPEGGAIIKFTLPVASDATV